jgi:hypothetical protein
MPDAGLHRRAREGGANGVGQALQAVDDHAQDVSAPLGLELFEDLEPALGPLGLLCPQAQHVAVVAGLHAQCQVDGFVANPSSSRILTRSASINATGYIAPSRWFYPAMVSATTS